MQNKQFQVQNKQSFTELTLDDLPRDTILTSITKEFSKPSLTSKTKQIQSN